MVWGAVNQPTLINPVLTSHSVSSALLGLIFDSLVRVDQNGRIARGLAHSWDISDDGLTYTFHLTRGVNFHDGAELTAHDVKFTYDAIQNEATRSPWRSNTLLVRQWEVVDRYTVRARLHKPFPALLFKLNREILPKHLYEHTDLWRNSHNQAPVGTGPFKFSSWNKNTNQITLVANPKYFEGRPYLDYIVVRVYQNNSRLWSALMRGEVDFVKFLNQRDFEVLSRDPSFYTYAIPTGMYYAVMYNIHDPILYDPEVRHALNYAVNRKALMEIVGINGVESNGPFYSKSQGFNKNVEAPAYNPVRAKLMLSWRGWSPGPDGVLHKSGQRLTLTMLVDRNRMYYRQMALALRQQLAEIGVNLKIVFYDDEIQLTPDYIARLKPQMWLRMFQGGSVDPSDMARTWYSSSSDFGRLWAYQDVKLDRLFEQGQTLKNGEERASIYRQIHALINKDQPACFLFFSMTYHAVSAKIKGAESFFSPHMPSEFIKYWFIK